MELTILVPYYKGQYFLPKLLDTLPRDIPVIVVNDQSPGGVPELSKWPNARVVQTYERGYFGGAVNRGLEEVEPGRDVLILNQDVRFTSDGWVTQLEKQLASAGLVGDFVKPNRIHLKGYVQGTFMAIRADVREKLGYFDADEYPHWGVTALYQMRACRAGFTSEPLKNLHKYMIHERDRQRGNRRYGSATQETLVRLRESEVARLTKTPISVSVIIPCYNKAAFVQEAVDSVLASTWQDFEIIIVEDASTDNSREIVERLVDPWKYVRAIYHDENKGVVASRNAGVKAASGELIFQLDADDLLARDGLERFVKAFRANPKRWVYTDLLYFKTEERDKPGTLRRFPEFDSPHPYAIGVRNVAQASIMYPKSWWQEVGGYHPEAERGHDDWCFAIQLTNAGHCGQRLQSVDGNQLPAVLYREVADSRNKTSRKRSNELREMKQRLWPEIFQGYRERIDIMACCGGRSRKKKAAATQMVQMPLGAETITVRYIGTAKAAFPKRGQSTRTRYIIRPGVDIEIHAADRKDFLSGRNAQEFRLVTPPTEVVQAATATNGTGSKSVLKKLNTMEPVKVPDPSTMKVTEAKAWVADTDDVEALKTFMEMEENGKDRSTLMTAVQGKLSEVVVA